MNSYKVRLRFYDRMPKTVYLQAENNAEAFSKAHRFITPESNCCEIIPTRISKKYMAENHLEYTPDKIFLPESTEGI